MKEIAIGINNSEFTSDVKDFELKATAIPESLFKETVVQYVSRDDLDLTEEQKAVLPEYVNVSLIENFNADDWEFESDFTVLSITEMLLNNSIPELETAEKIFTADTKENMSAEGSNSKSLVEKLKAKTISDDTFPKTKNYSIKADITDFSGIVNLSEMFTKDYWIDTLKNVGKGLLNELTDGLQELGKSLLDWAITPAHLNLPNPAKQLSEKNKNRDYSSPIQVLLARAPDMFSNMYDIWFSPIGDPTRYTDDVIPTKEFEEWRIYSAKIKGIDIPQPKKETFTRQAVGRTIEIPKTEVSIQKVFTLTVPLDANYFLLDDFLVNKFYYVNQVGTLKDYFFKNNNLYDMVVKYKPYYGTKNSNSDYSVIRKENGELKTYDLSKDRSLYSSFDGESSTTGPSNKNSDNPTRYFIFKNVRCLGVGTNDLQYNNQSANPLECQLKFTFRKVEEIDENTLSNWKSQKGAN